MNMKQPCIVKIDDHWAVWGAHSFVNHDGEAIYCICGPLHLCMYHSKNLDRNQQLARKATFRFDSREQAEIVFCKFLLLGGQIAIADDVET